MLIVVEGPDASGKSTLARRMATSKLIDVHHHGPYPGVGDVVRRYLTSVRQSRVLRDARGFGITPSVLGVVMDRSWYSEPIYGRVKRNGEDRVGVMRRVLEREALGASGVLVLSRASLAWTSEKWRTSRDVQYLGHPALHEQVWHEYQHLSSELPTVEYDPEQGTEAWRVLEQVGEVRVVNRGPGVGCFRKGCVLVVEDWPFHDQETEIALDSLGVREDDLYWVVPGESPEFLEELEPRDVLAVGEESDAWCSATDEVGRWQTVAPEDLARTLGKMIA